MSTEAQGSKPAYEFAIRHEVLLWLYHIFLAISGKTTKDGNDRYVRHCSVDLEFSHFGFWELSAYMFPDFHGTWYYFFPDSLAQEARRQLLVAC